MEAEKLIQEVEDLCKNVARYIETEKGVLKQSDIQFKGRNDLVSRIDIESEEQIKKKLSNLLPEASFLAEESSKDYSEEGKVWIIDPIDGTTNFIHQIPTYAISIALYENGEAKLGVVYEINRDECFSAIAGKGAKLNGEKIGCSGGNILDNALLATGFPYTDFSEADNYIFLLKELMQLSRGIRRIGSAAVDLCYTACGRFDGFYEWGLSPWDVAAGALIVKEAGGVVSDFKGGDDYLFGKEIVAAHPALQNELRTIIHKRL